MPLPLTDFTIERFRGLREVELKKLGRVNLLVGPNNSGKTSILESLILYGRPLDPLAWQGAASLRDGFVVRGREPESLRWLFPVSEEEEVRGGSGAIQSRCSLRGQGTFSVQHVESTYKPLARLGAPSQRQPGAELAILVSLVPSEGLPAQGRRGLYTFWSDEPFVRQGAVPEPKLPVEFVSPYGHRLDFQLVQSFKQTTLEEKQHELLELLVRIDPSIERIESLPGDGQEASLYFKLRENGYLPINAMGDGIRRSLALALALLQAKGGLLLVDELESAFHFAALKRVFSWLLEACRQYDVQLFATTHSLEAIDAVLAVDQTEEEDIVTYRLERQGRHYQAVRLGEGELRLLRNELGQEVRGW